MKLDVNALRYLSRDESRTLQAVEIGQKNHDIVPVPLVDSIAGLKHGGTVRCLKALLRQKLVHHDNSRYDGYRLTPLGYDFLALKALVARGAITAVGRQIGVGKESDVFEVLNAEGEVLAMKLHRLGRTSFRAVKKKRDYLQHRNSFSWLWLSRLAAAKEHAFMEALSSAGFPVPRAMDHNRHAVLMSLVNAVPLVQVKLADPGAVYIQLMDMLGDLASRGLVHCDFNEFNILVSEEGEVTLIDFPQMISTNHPNAEELFERDVDCVVRFFTKKLGYVPERDASLPYLRPDFKEVTAAATEKLDVQLAASGFKKEHFSALDSYVSALQGMVAPRDGDSSSGSEESGESDDESDGSECSDEEARSEGKGEEGEEGKGGESEGEQEEAGCSGRSAVAADVSKLGARSEGSGPDQDTSTSQSQGAKTPGGVKGRSPQVSINGLSIAQSEPGSQHQSLCPPQLRSERCDEKLIAPCKQEDKAVL